MEPPAPSAGEGRVGHVIYDAIGSVQGPRYRAVGATEATLRTLQRYRGGVTEAHHCTCPRGMCVPGRALLRRRVHPRSAVHAMPRTRTHSHARTQKRRAAIASAIQPAMNERPPRGVVGPSTLRSGLPAFSRHSP